jgi:hypothetical protein
MTASLIRRMERTEAANRGISVDVRSIDVVASVSSKLTAFTNLKANWAGHGSGPISQTVTQRAQRACAIFATSAGLPAPSVVPTPDGAIQLEWHTHAFDLEVDVDEQTVDIYLKDARTGQRREFLELRKTAAVQDAARQLSTFV